jgi:hypothetical protein
MWRGAISRTITFVSIGAAHCSPCSLFAALGGCNASGRGRGRLHSPFLLPPAVLALSPAKDAHIQILYTQTYCLSAGAVYLTLTKYSMAAFVCVPLEDMKPPVLRCMALASAHPLVASLNRNTAHAVAAQQSSHLGITVGPVSRGLNSCSLLQT